MEFTGNSGIAKLDAQGRVPVPVTLRRILQQSEDNTLFVSIDIYKDCLELYPRSTWEAIKAQYRERLDLLEEDDRDFYESLVAAVDRLEMDTVGRIQLTKRAMKHANITTEARFVGIDDKIKIWNPENYEEFEQTNRENFKANAKKLFSKKTA